MTLKESYHKNTEIGKIIRAGSAPLEMQQLKQWVVWKLVRAKDARLTKVPYQAKSPGRKASTTNDRTWATYEQARQCVIDGNADGIGFVFTQDLGFTFIDIDSCIDDDGKIAPHAIAILNQFPTHAHLSQSRRGLHIVAAGIAPMGLIEHGVNNRKHGVEIYTTGRFMAMPLELECVGPVDRIEDCSEAIEALYEQYKPQEVKGSAEPVRYIAGVREIIDKLSTGTNRGKMYPLLSGDASGYGSHSEARFALAGGAGFYSDDHEVIAGILLHSGLFKDSDSEGERQRRASMDAKKSVSTYTGARYDPNYGKTIFRPVENPEDLETPGDDDSDDGTAALQLNESLWIADNRVWEKKELSQKAIANGLVRITGYVVEELAPGEVRTSFRVRGILATGKHLPEITIPTKDFLDMRRWISGAGPLWAQLVIEPGTKPRDQFHAATLLYGAKIGYPSLTIHHETGWIEHDGSPVFRLHGGAIGAAGIVDNIDVQLDPGFRVNAVEPIPDRDTLKTYGRQWLRLMDLARPEEVAPFLATVPLAILSGEFIKVAHALYIHGTSGLFKTEMSVLLPAHFGRNHNSGTVSLNFESTRNMLEAAQFRLKNLVVLVDDFNLTGVRRHDDAAIAIFNGLRRGAGNQNGRGRMRVDITIRPTFHPRGVTIFTGEDIAGSFSSNARTLSVGIEPGTIKVNALTDCQEYAANGVFSGLTASFIQHIAANWDRVKQAVDVALKAETKLFRSAGAAHARIADQLAPSMVALTMWFEHLRSLGAISEQECVDYLATMRKGLNAAGATQGDTQSLVNPVNVFVDAVRTAVVRGDAHLADKVTGDSPDNPQRYGWRIEKRTSFNGATFSEKPMGSLIGWVDESTDALYLDPESAYAISQRLGRDTGRSIGATVTTLGKRLKESKRIVSTDANRSQLTIYVNRAKQRVWYLRLSDVFGVEDSSDSTEPTPFRKEVA